MLFKKSSRGKHHESETYRHYGGCLRRAEVATILTTMKSSISIAIRIYHIAGGMLNSSAQVNFDSGSALSPLSIPVKTRPKHQVNQLQIGDNPTTSVSPFMLKLEDSILS